MAYTFLQLQTRVAAEINDVGNANVSLAQVKASIVSAIEHYERQRQWFNETISRSVVTVVGAPAVAVPSDLVFLERVQCATTGTVTGDANGSATISNVSDVSVLQSGMFVTQALIPASTMIRSVGASSFTMMDVYGASVTASTTTTATIRYASKTTRNLREVPYDEFAGREWQISEGEPTNYSYHQDRIWLWPKPNAVYSLILWYVQRLTTLSADGDNNGWTNYAEPVIRNRAKWDIFNNYLYMPKQAMISKQQEIDAMTALETEMVQRNTTGRLKPKFL
jgi:hypothetical protein